MSPHHMYVGASRSQKRASDALELELQLVVSCTGAGNHPSSARLNGKHS